MKTSRIKIAALFAASLITLTACATPTVIDANGGEEPGTNNGPSIPTDFSLSDLPDISNIEIGENINPPGPSTFTTLDDYYNQEIPWFDCTDEFQCAPIFVPKDWNNPTDGALYIATVRLPSSSDNPKGSLLMNPGGPGASGVELVFGSGKYATTAEVRANYDLIGFDPRGVGYSDSVYCGPGEVLDAFFLDPGPQAPIGSPESIQESKRKSSYMAQACKNGTGDLLQYLDTISAAKDMDIIRAVLGDDKLHYLGFSYGTQLGATYAALFPENVGKLVLDGAVNPTLTPEESNIRQAAGFELAFNNYIANCLKLNNCPVPGNTVSEVSKEISEFLLPLESTPLTTKRDNELGIWPAVIGIINNLYVQSSWDTLSYGIREAYTNKDGTPLLESAYQYLQRNNSGEYYGDISTSNIAINCLDDEYSNDPAIIAATNAAIEEVAPFFGRYFSNSYVSCSGWLYDSIHQNVTLDFGVALANPVLVIGTTGDPATPYRNAIDLADILNPGVLLTYDGEGHTIYANRNSCIDTVVDNYLIRGVLPVDNTTVCK